jgi:hypothetical protein
VRTLRDVLEADILQSAIDVRFASKEQIAE